MTKINGYPIDCATGVKYSRKAEATEHPVESGTNISDHLRAQEPDLEIEGVVSDTPSGALASDSTRSVPSPSLAAFRFLDDLTAAGQLVTVECSYGVFESMGITKLDAPRDHKSRKSFKFTIGFKHIRIVVNVRTVIKASVPVGNPNFGLSLDKVVDGKHVLWRKGKPPGTSPSTDPPGVIVGQEVVTVADRTVVGIKKKFLHASGKELTTKEKEDFTKDLNRDSSINTQRGLAKSQKKLDDIGRRIDGALHTLDLKDIGAKLAKTPDPGALGK
jgi:hypothetical protein